MMREITREQIIRALDKVGISKGDGLLIHSAIQFLGQPEEGLTTYLNALQAIIGEGGTIVVPTFTFSFARGERYNPLETPAVGMGSFSEFIRQQPGALRTPHPMQSVAALGYYARQLAKCDTSSAFDRGSAFERMLELDFKILLLGANINAVSFVHYSEQHLGVPYRYWKAFTGEVMTESGWQTRSYRMYVRDLDINPQLDLSPIQKILEEREEWHSVPINYGHLTQFRATDFISATNDLLIKDRWSLIANRQ